MTIWNKMGIVAGLVSLAFISCQFKQENETTTKNSKSEQHVLPGTKQDSLFLFEIKIEGNSISVKAPDESDFPLPDDSAKIKPTFKDFNADNKEDVMLYLGACGSGGCMYGVFLNEHGDYYRLAFMDYLKGMEFEKEQNGSLSIKSQEDIVATSPLELYVSKFKLNTGNHKYELDTSFVVISVN